MAVRYRTRRLAALVVIVVIAILFAFQHESFWEQRAVSPPINSPNSSHVQNATQDARDILETLPVKGRAPKTGYTRLLFGGQWKELDGVCDTRNIILHRDLTGVVQNDKCQVLSGTLADPYTGKTIHFQRGATTSSLVQIDHVVAISNAWQTGAQQLSQARREALYLDPLELLAVDGEANNQKSDGDAATWLPSNKAFRCQYVARQIAVKKKYDLWVTPPEKTAIINVLTLCPGQTIPQDSLRP